MSHISRVTLLIAALTPALAGICAASANAQRVAVLQFAIVPVGVNDEVLPSSREIHDLSGDLRTAIGTRKGVMEVSVNTACEDVACALKVGRSTHSDVVVYGEVTRYMALLWSMELASVNVRTGQARALQQPYKGDISALEQDMPDLARQLHL